MSWIEIEKKLKTLIIIDINNFYSCEELNLDTKTLIETSSDDVTWVLEDNSLKWLIY